MRSGSRVRSASPRASDGERDCRERREKHCKKQPEQPCVARGSERAHGAPERRIERESGGDGLGLSARRLRARLRPCGSEPRSSTTSRSARAEPPPRAAPPSTHRRSSGEAASASPSWCPECRRARRRGNALGVLSDRRRRSLLGIERATRERARARRARRSTPDAASPRLVLTRLMGQRVAFRVVPAVPAAVRRLDPGLLVTIAVAAVLVWIAFDNGSYGLPSRATLAIVVWWAVLLAVALGLPSRDAASSSRGRRRRAPGRSRVLDARLGSLGAERRSGIQRVQPGRALPRGLRARRPRRVAAHGRALGRRSRDCHSRDHGRRPGQPPLSRHLLRPRSRGGASGFRDEAQLPARILERPRDLRRPRCATASAGRARCPDKRRSRSRTGSDPRNRVRHFSDVVARRRRDRSRRNPGVRRAHRTAVERGGALSEFQGRPRRSRSPSSRAGTSSSNGPLGTGLVRDQGRSGCASPSDWWGRQRARYTGSAVGSSARRVSPGRRAGYVAVGVTALVLARRDRGKQSCRTLRDVPCSSTGARGVRGQATSSPRIYAAATAAGAGNSGLLRPISPPDNVPLGDGAGAYEWWWAENGSIATVRERRAFAVPGDARRARGTRLRARRRDRAGRDLGGRDPRAGRDERR